MIVHKSEITRRVRLYAIGVFTILIMMAGCDSIISPDTSINKQQQAIQSSGQSSNMGQADPTFSDPGNRPDIVEGHYIIVLSEHPGRDNPRAVAALDALSKDVGNMQGARVKHTYRHALTGFSAELTDEQASILRNDPRVQSIEQDHYMYPPSDFTVQQYPTWGLDRIDQRGALLDRAYAYTGTGQGVTIYNVDSGIRYTHAEFGGRARNGYDFVLEDNPGNTDPNQGPGEDCMGHGTHVAGTLAGTTYGVAKEAQLVSVRIFGCTGGSTRSRTIAAVDWVTADHLARRDQDPLASSIANLEVVGPAGDALDDAVRTMIGSGVAAVAAAGNHGALDGACTSSPSRVAEAMTIGAADIDNSRASFSNHGACVDWFAPGVRITSASHLDDSATRLSSGTSMAMPHTAGVAAIYLEANPGASPAEVFAALQEATTKDVVTMAAPGANHMLYSLFQPVEFTPPAWNFNLTASGTKVRGNQVVDLSWNPLIAMTEITRDGSLIGYAYENNDFFRDNTGISGNHSTYVHQICESSPFYLPSCSEEITTIFGNGGDDGGGEDPNSPPSADFTYQADKLAVQFTDTSTDSDGTITGWQWDFGDGNSSNEQNPLHIFSVAGTYPVLLTVTDNDGDTGSTSKNITVIDDEIQPGDIVLNANGYKQRGRIIIDLSWSGATSATVDIYRDGVPIDQVSNGSGAYSDHTGQNGGGTFTHKICEAGTQSCSNETTTTL